MRHGHGRPWWHERFIEEGLRFTSPRESIIDAMSRSSRHLSAEEIYFIVHGLYPAIGFATVYRTLDLLTKIGLVSKFEFGDGRARYELTRAEQGMHYHLICSKCGKVINENISDKELKIFKKIEENLSKKNNFKIKNLKIHFIGECEQCQNFERLSMSKRIKK